MSYYEFTQCNTDLNVKYESKKTHFTRTKCNFTCFKDGVKIDIIVIIWILIII